MLAPVIAVPLFLSDWLSTPEGRQRLKVPFVRRYVNALRWMLQLLRPEAFCKVTSAVFPLCVLFFCFSDSQVIRLVT